LSGARVQWLEERCTFAAFGALPTSLENPLEEIVFTPGRTHNRSSGGIGARGPWEPVRTGFTPAQENEWMLKWLKGESIKIKV